MRTSSAGLGVLLVGALLQVAHAAPNQVTIHSDEQGRTLRIDGVDTMLFGMNWGYVPVGENYSYDFWSQPEAVIETILRRDMSLLADMGVNSIRQYPGIPPRWVEFIHDEYGIYTMINPLVGRYGTTVDGRFVPQTPYGDPAVRQALKDETLAVVERYKDVRGVVMILLGNEANYGLEWTSFEIQALPKDQQQSARARALYSLYGEIIDEIHAVDDHHPVAIANGDLQYLDLIAELAPNMDVMAANVYRGASARDLYQRVEDELGVPFVFSEFGSDAYNALEGREDALMQARYLHAQWQEIYEQSAGKGKVGNAIGGYIFQWADGWWKYLQEDNLDIHDTHASWPNDAYPDDFVDAGNNMNEEWFGIAARTPPGPTGIDEVQPRTAYWMLRDAFELDPYADGTDLQTIAEHFASIRPADYSFRYDAVQSSARLQQQRARVSNLRVELYTVTSGGSEREGSGPANASVDHMQSIYTDFEVQPVDEFVASASVNVLGNVPSNRIDPIFFENRGTRGDQDLVIDGIDLSGTERVKLYNAGFTWNHDWFDLEGYYRVGHYHWGYEGDFFGLYQEANYGPAVDLYNADVPIGVTFHGKRALEGLDIAFGPQIYWGANPTAIAKYTRTHGEVTWSVMHQEDIARTSLDQTSTSGVIAEQMLRRSTAYLSLGDELDTRLELGGIWAGTNKIGQSFTRIQPATGDASYNDSGFDVIDDQVRMVDTLGGKFRLTAREGRFGWYAQGAYKGLVADGGPDAVITLTGWTLKESGRGNQMNALSGAILQVGAFQIAPNFLYQRPLVGPNVPIGDAYDPVTRVYQPAVTARNVIDDPFAVLDNRETLAGELMLVFDPTPGSWFFQWNNEIREDAPFAGALDFVYRHQPTVRDAAFGFTEEGVLFAFDGSPPARDVWDVNGRFSIALPFDGRLHVLAYVGEAQANGTDARVIFRKGVNARMRMRSLVWDSWLKLDDWGPYDWHRDFNVTYPVQVISDLSAGLGRAPLVGPSTRFGTQLKVRTLDEFSPDTTYLVDRLGNEFEVLTYVKVSL